MSSLKESRIIKKVAEAPKYAVAPTKGLSTEQVEERKKDAKANMEYFYQQLIAIPAIKEMLESKKNIAITSGSSTPNSVTNQVIETIKKYIDTDIFELPKEIDIRLL